MKELHVMKKITMKTSILIIVAFAFINISSAVDYCNIKNCKKGQQTVCRFPSNRPSSHCTGDIGGGVSKKEINDILRVHNELRQKVARGQEGRGNPGGQPRAKYMPNLVWDNELAFVAQRWADQCSFGHDTCRNVDRFSVGQNVYSKGTTGNLDSIKVADMVYGWYDEVKNYNRNDVGRFKGVTASNGKVIGHYTQVVWAGTTKIGCGVRKYVSGQYKTVYFVCNYGPAGNVIGYPVYQVA